MKMLTVMDMYILMQDLIAQGKGDSLVLMPNWTDENNDGDYRSIGEISDDMSDTCVYLCGNNAEEENKFWEEWWQNT